MKHTVTLFPGGRVLEAAHGCRLLELLRSAGYFVEAPCGGNGTCGKCTVEVDGQPVRACAWEVNGDIRVTLPPATQPTPVPAAHRTYCGSCAVAIDIGTTTVVCALLTDSGEELATESAANPQVAYGADVVSRIRHAQHGQQQALCAAIRSCVNGLLERCCAAAGVLPEQIRRVVAVGNPCMQQLFLGMAVDNLAAPPFLPVLTEAARFPAAACLPLLPNATVLAVPDIAGFVGADTLACVLASRLHHATDTVLLVDIGTHGELVLYHEGRMAACATAAGPALEGAGISCGMRAAPGAIDRVDAAGLHVIGDGSPLGLCGSGLVDAAAMLLSKGLLNRRGRLLTDTRTYPLAPGVTLTQEDIRQLQLAKGAIATGIHLLAEHMGIPVSRIDRCLLAGAFGAHLEIASACRIGLLPPELACKTVAAGNLALTGACLLATDPQPQSTAQAALQGIEALELASLPGFARRFAQHTAFQEDTWLVAARECGFAEAAQLRPDTLRPQPSVREACAADVCRAYGKNWTCPPHCGTLEECAARLQCYSHGLLLQTVGQLSKDIDTRGYAQAEQAHLQALQAFAWRIRQVYPQALCLGSGGCRICVDCAYPAPCRFPEQACSSMEAYGLFVTQVCRDNGLAYHHGPRTVTFTACVLF